MTGINLNESEEKPPKQENKNYSLKTYFLSVV